MGIIPGILSMFGWGTADFLAAKSSRNIGYCLTLFWMQLAGTLVALIYFLLNFHTFKMINVPKSLFLLPVVGLLQTIAYLSFYKGLKEGQVSIVSPIASSWAVVTVILSAIFFKEALIIPQIISIILIISGITLISIDFKELSRIKKLKIFTGTKEGLIAMLGWGISFFLMTPASRSLGWFLPVFIFKLFAIAFLFFYILTRIDRNLLKKSAQLSTMIFLLPIGFLDVGSFFSYSFGIRMEYSSIVAPIAASFPLITIILARIFLKEKLAINQIVGIAITIGGIILISI